MKIYIIYPSNGHSAYKIAAEEFSSYCERTSSIRPILITDKAELPSDADGIVVIGSDAVNNYAAGLYLARKIDDLGFRYNTDAYRVFTKEIDGVSHLFIAGARPRATLYATYRYFEKILGCRWFWDGDRIPHRAPSFTGVDINESPRFEYRGIRYFAHRSLHRFQAEHWSLEDWKHEIDWIVKKRFNTFMLRIGLDDIFQKAFPDLVPYPSLNEPFTESGINHHDRTPFWSLKYRGELRRAVLAYAFERDLMHPEDCGTVTHWYSRTPKTFLDKVNPKLLLGTKYGGEPTAQTWDILDDENLERYFKLTDTHIKEYGRGDIFHTIGLAERSFSEDPEVNMRLKMYVYRRISAYLKERYPGAPLLVASWDIYAHTPDEAARVLRELDPSQCLLLDYTSDSMIDNNFTRWGVIGKFPWIFGMFSGFEPDNELRGFYHITEERLKLAKADPYCKGAVLWPEMSHGDNLCTEYLARNAWDSETLSLDDSVELYCRDRYSEDDFEKMHSVWRDFMPILGMRSWSPKNSIDMNLSQNTFVWLEQRARFEDGDYPYAGRSPEEADSYTRGACSVLRALAEIEPRDEMHRRDIYDIARTVISRYLDCAIRLSELCYLNGGDGMSAAMEASLGLMRELGELLRSHEDYSLYSSLERLRSVTETNPSFEETLKQNATGYYCRSYISENVDELYLPEMIIIFDEVKAALASGSGINREAISARIAENTRRFFSTPLKKMAEREAHPPRSALLAAADIIEKTNFRSHLR